MLTVTIYRPNLAALNLPTVAPIEVHVLDDGRVVANYDGAASALYDSLDALCRSTATGPGTTSATPAEIRDTILAAVVPDAKTDSPLVQHYDAEGLAALLTLHEREYGELPKGWSDPVQVTELWQRSTGAVEADLVVSIDGVWVAGDVTLHPDPTKPAIGMFGVVVEFDGSTGVVEFDGDRPSVFFDASQIRETGRIRARVGAGVLVQWADAQRLLAVHVLSGYGKAGTGPRYPLGTAGARLMASGPLIDAVVLAESSDALIDSIVRTVDETAFAVGV